MAAQLVWGGRAVPEVGGLDAGDAAQLVGPSRASVRSSATGAVVVHLLRVLDLGVATVENDNDAAE